MYQTDEKIKLKCRQVKNSLQRFNDTTHALNAINTFEMLFFRSFRSLQKSFVRNLTAAASAAAVAMLCTRTCSCCVPSR